MKQLIKANDYLAYNDPLLDYLIDVANHFCKVIDKGTQ